MNIETKVSNSTISFSTNPVSADVGKKKPTDERIKTVVTFAFLPRFRCNSDGTINPNFIYAPLVRGDTITPEMEQEMERCEPDSPTFNPIALYNAIAIRDVAFKQQVQKTPAKPSLTAQQAMVQKQLKEWESTFAINHRGVGLACLGFLQLEQLIQISACTLLLDLQKKKKLPTNGVAVAAFIGVLPVEKWAEVGVKKMSEHFGTLLENVSVSQPEKEQFKKHFNRLILLSLQSDCFKLAIGSESEPTFASRRPALEYVSKILKELFQLLDPSIERSLLELRAFQKYLVEFSIGNLMVMRNKTKELNMNFALYAIKSNAMANVWLDWFRLLNAVTNFSLKSIQKQVKELSPAVDTLHAVDLLDQRGGEFISSAVLCTENLCEKIVAYEKWATFFADSRSGIPETEKFHIQFFQDLHNNAAQLMYDLSRTIVNFYDDNRKEIESDKSGVLLKGIKSMPFCIEMLSVLKGCIECRIAEIAAEGDKDAKNQIDARIELLQKNRSPLIKKFIQIFFKSVQEEVDKYVLRGTELILEIDDLCPGGGYLKEIAQHRAGFCLNSLVMPINNQIDLIRSKEQDPSFLSRNNVKGMMELLSSFIARCGVGFEAYFGGRGNNRYEQFLQAMHQEFSTLPSETSLHFVFSSMSNVAALEQLRSLQNSVGLYGKVLPILKACREGILSNSAPIFEDDSWLDKIDDEAPMESPSGASASRASAETEAEEKEELDDLMMMPPTQPKRIGKAVDSPIAQGLVFIPPTKVRESPFEEFVRDLANFQSISAVRSPSDLRGAKLDRSLVAKHQQLHAAHCFQMSVQMLQTAEQVQDQELLAALFFFWGHQWIEQSLTSVYVKKVEAEILPHSLNDLLNALDLGDQYQWVKHANKATFYSRYPFSYASQSEDCPLALKLNTSLGKNEAALKEFRGVLESAIQEAVQIQTAAAASVCSSDQETELKALQKSAKALGSTPLLNSTVKQTVPEDENPELESLEKCLAEVEEVLNKQTSEKFSGTYAKQMSKRLGNVAYHLSMLRRLIGLVKRFSEARYSLIHAQAGVLFAQYLAENLGAFLALKNGINLVTHDLRVYIAFYGLSKSVAEEEMVLLEQLNVKKGSEYVYKYFKDTPKELVSPFMELINELAVLSRSIALYGEGFTPSGRKPQNIPSLQKQLIGMLTNLSQLSVKLIEIHLLA